MANSDWRQSQAVVQAHNAAVDFEKQLRRCMEAVEVLLTRTEATHKELRGLKVKLEAMKQLLPLTAAEKAGRP
jgi:hypothetical protein